MFAQSPREPMPNIVFILADDLGYGDLSSYGCEDIRTPHLDRLAAEGVRFTDFYANGAVCSPTRIAFITGRYQQRLGMENALTYQEFGRGLEPNAPNMVTDLRDAGYATGLCGKWHLGYDEGRKPLQQGFGFFFGLLSGNHHYFEHMDRIGAYDLWLGNETIVREGYTTDLITQEAVGFIRDHVGRRTGRPFFLYLSHAAPHFPWQGPGDRDKLVQPKKKNWQEGDRETYAAMVESMDAGIGRVLDELERQGVSGNTLVVFMSDNGGHTYSRNAPLSGWKGEMWEGGIRVPCVARWPGVLKAGAESDLVGITMDWSATFRRIAGYPADTSREDGIDLLPYLTAQEAAPGRRLFWRRVDGPRRKVPEPGRAMRWGDWKLREMADGGRTLVNLREDIGEHKNLIETYPERAREMKEAMDRWEEEVGYAWEK
ncbi:MAG: sulfatase-like hydrolase/transferase [Planctomycetota bacterium]